MIPVNSSAISKMENLFVGKYCRSRGSGGRKDDNDNNGSMVVVLVVGGDGMPMWAPYYVLPRNYMVLLLLALSQRYLKDDKRQSASNFTVKEQKINK